MADWLSPKAALIARASGNRGNFCLINDIDFDIFPRPRRPPLAPGFLFACRRPLRVTVAGNRADVMRKILRGRPLPPPLPPKCARVMYPRYKKIFISLRNTDIPQGGTLDVPRLVDPTVLIIIW